MRYDTAAVVSDLPPLLQKDDARLQNLCILTHTVSMMTSSAWDKVYYTDKEQM